MIEPSWVRPRRNAVHQLSPLGSERRRSRYWNLRWASQEYSARAVLLAVRTLEARKDDVPDCLVDPAWSSSVAVGAVQGKSPGKLTWLSVRIQRPGRLPFNGMDADHATFLGLISVLQHIGLSRSVR
jgi:hypothetical protein